MSGASRLLSFRTRLFATAALIVIAVLATVLVVGWQRVLGYEGERLDDRLCLEARRIATQLLDEDDISRVEADVAQKLRLAGSAELRLAVEHAGGEGGWRSAGWLPALQADGLAWKAAPRALGVDRPPLLRPPPGLLPGGGPGFGQPPGGGRPPPRERALPPPPAACELATHAEPGRDWRVARFHIGPERSFVAVDVAATRRELQSAVGRALMWVLPLALGLTALGAWMLASLTMRPVNRLRESMKGVTRAGLDQRLPSRGEDREFAELIAAYNTMLQRLEASFHQANRFSGDAAHELKTPLTILQGRIEQAVSRSDRRAIQADLSEMLDEVARLSDITRKLLLLSQADAGRLSLQREPVDLSELLEGLVADAQMLLDGRPLQSHIAPKLVTAGDALLLRQLLNNLLSNAVRHGRAGGWIRVEGQRRRGGVEIGFANACVAIPTAQREHFFDRFWRGDAAHARSTQDAISGSGLGLGLAREIARAHGGDLVLEPGPEDEVTLRLWLPQR